jgi:8-oxo-dGTP pyrophosphatase MutT (NUDIX family)
MKNAEHGHWDFPKGHVEPGEDETQAALRETREESGLTEMRIIPGFRESIFYRVDIKGRRAESGNKEVAYFLGEVPAEAEPELSDEHTDCKWLPFKQAISLIKFDNARDLLARADAFLKPSSG